MAAAGFSPATSALFAADSPHRGSQTKVPKMALWDVLAGGFGGAGRGSVALGPSAAINSGGLLARKLPANASAAAITPGNLKEQARRGLPADQRPDAWLMLSGGRELAAAHAPGYYASLAASTADLPEEVIFAVEDDVRATQQLFRQQQHARLFSTAKGLESLSRVLLGFAHRGAYFRGLAHVAAVMLVAFGREREEDAFWTLAAMYERRLFPGCKGEVMLGTRVEVQVLQALLEEKAPLLASELGKLGPDVLEQLASGWFSAAFTRVLPVEVVLRIWDCLLVEGAKVAHRVAIALLKSCASSIHSCQSLPVLLRVVEGRLARTTDADALLAAAFKGVGRFGSAHVEAVRGRVQLVVQRQISAARARLAVLVGRDPSPPTPRTA